MLTIVGFIVQLPSHVQLLPPHDRSTPGLYYWFLKSDQIASMNNKYFVEWVIEMNKTVEDALLIVQNR